MSLSQVLTRLIGQASPERAAALSLKSGLRVSVRVLPGGTRQMSLTRIATQKPSWKEAEVCAEHAGWGNALIETGQTRTGLACLLVTEDTSLDPERPGAGGLDILARVDARRPLGQADSDAVRALIAGGQLHVTAVFDRTDPCPYRLTEAGRQALAWGARRP